MENAATMIENIRISLDFGIKAPVVVVWQWDGVEWKIVNVEDKKR